MSKYREKQVAQMSELLHDLTVLKDGALTIDQIVDDYDRENVVEVANKLFDLNVADVKNKRSVKYVAETEIISKMVALVK